MKIFRLFILSFSCIILISCSNNDSRDNVEEVKTVADTDGNTYDVVKICDKNWMKRNLEVMHYRNGDLIPQVTDPIAWAKLTTGAWCYYQNDPNNNKLYGKLYNWYAVKDPRGIAPVGWHIPSENEVLSMIDCLGGWQVAGGKMKSTINFWASPNLGANNYSGFTSLPGGARNSTAPGSNTPSASFLLPGISADWWTSTTNGTSAVAYTNSYQYTTCYTYLTAPTSGFSVRCVKD